MQTLRGSCHNLAALGDGLYGDVSRHGLQGARGCDAGGVSTSRGSLDSQDSSPKSRIIIVSNHLPLRAKRNDGGSWEFEWDDDALVAQAKDGLGEDLDVVYVGSLSVEIDKEDEEAVTSELKARFKCSPVFLGEELKRQYYKAFCKQQLWPLFHYVLPMSPHSPGRFDPRLWQDYVKANKSFCKVVVEECATDTDFVWIHDYHLLVLPSLLRKRFNRSRIGVFLHSPFPSSEIFRTFPKREELLRSLLNADLIGFHTFDYARHFLSCCSRMLGLDHQTARGSIGIEYYGRNVGIKIMPTGVNPNRLLSGFDWSEFQWRRGELISQFQGKTVLVGVDDMDVFKGIELKLLAFERVLDFHPEWRGKLVLVQMTNAPRASSEELTELRHYVHQIVERIQKKYGGPAYDPVCYLERHVPLHERIAFYSIAECAVVTPTRDGMNLVPYEYVVCRQGPDRDTLSKRDSMLVVSEFVGCSPSLSGAIRVNPWSLESVADGIYTAIKMPLEHRRLRHEKHWKYVSQHTVAYWAQSYVADLQRVTKNHVAMRSYNLGLGLDTFRMVALDANFRRLDDGMVLSAYRASQRRLFFLDYDGTLIGANSITAAPTEEVHAILKRLTADPRNLVYIISGRARRELGEWFKDQSGVGLAAEHGFFFRPPHQSQWEVLNPAMDFSWMQMALPIMKHYQESTDGSSITAKESALVWHYGDADPDLGTWQAKELLDHLEDVLSNLPIEVLGGQTIVEVKPLGVSKGMVVEQVLRQTSAESGLAVETGDPPPAVDFILCIGDDRSDEEMFNTMEHAKLDEVEIFPCVVGQRPSKAPYYLNDAGEVLQLLAKLVGMVLPARRSF